jgi:hypothetical protein
MASAVTDATTNAAKRCTGGTKRASIATARELLSVPPPAAARAFGPDHPKVALSLITVELSPA